MENQWHRVKGGGRRVEKWDIARDDRRKSSLGSRSSSFFVTEFGEKWKAKDLFFEFKVLGEIEEVVIPPRRDKHGRRFGFVQFFNVKDEEMMATKFDNIILEGRKIFANLPRFRRVNGARGKVFKKDALKMNDVVVGAKYVARNKSNMEARRGHTSYAEILQNKQGEVDLKCVKKPSKQLVFSMSQDKSRYLKAFTGRLREPGNMIDLKKLFLEEGIFSIRVTSLGPNLCLLEDLIGGEVDMFIEERRLWWEQWFFSIKPWEPSDIDTERLVWLRIWGVPCHAWGDSCFSLLTESIGVFIKSDERTNLKSRMDEARVCIRTKSMERVEEVISLTIDGMCFDIRLMEDYHSCFGTVATKRFLGESDSEASLSEEDNLNGDEADGVDQNRSVEEDDLEEDEGSVGKRHRNKSNPLGVSLVETNEKVNSQASNVKGLSDPSGTGNMESFEGNNKVAFNADVENCSFSVVGGVFRASGTTG
ncbi:uncharacterized protein LOC131623755 [Vicia villosa]|uniref:uncharacterized protein LOC131623755 n=1 Tax=Vicia villosa TaxID=3911 RepID=UPI00273C75FF|nr:uncharacterized protein LOC131623755 [Vicia villosa]